MRLHFRLRWVSLIATMIIVATGLSLGHWQTRRAEQKMTIAAAIASRSQQAPVAVAQLPSGVVPEEFTPMTASGHFLGDWPVYLENRPMNGKAGFYLLMPFRLADSERVVLVQRGWFARDARDRQRLPAIPVPLGSTQVIGLARTAPGKLMQLGDAPELVPGAIVQNLDIPILAAASGLPLQNFIIEQTNNAADGLLRDWPTPASGIDTHRGYAFQWYALAAAAFLFFIVTGFRRASKPKP